MWMPSAADQILSVSSCTAAPTTTAETEAALVDCVTSTERPDGAAGSAASKHRGDANCEKRLEKLDIAFECCAWFHALTLDFS